MADENRVAEDEAEEDILYHLTIHGEWPQETETVVRPSCMSANIDSLICMIVSVLYVNVIKASLGKAISSYDMIYNVRIPIINDYASHTLSY